MTQAIPASLFVSVSPGVISAGGSALDVVGLFLTNSTQVPIGTVISFASAAAVGTYFGLASAEYAAAVVYFNGFDNSPKKPGAVKFAQYNTVATSGYVRGGAITLAQVQAITSGTLSITPDGGAVKTSSSLNLSSAVSLSAAAATITAAFTSPGFVVTYDSLSGAFVVTSNSTGSTSSIVVSAGAVATALNLTAETGAVTSPGAAAATPGAFMSALTTISQDWVSFSTLWEPVTSDGLAFANWTSGQNNRYAFVAWDTDAQAYVNNSTTSLAYLVKAANDSGTILVYSPTNLALMAAFIMGAIASQDFTALNGRVTLAFRSQSGLPADVSSQTIAAQLTLNGYNWYGAVATANQGFTFLSNGQISGVFLWVDSFINQIWMNSAFQLALLSLMTAVGNIPFNPAGRNLIASALNDPINAAVRFGAIRPGVTLSALQVAEVNNAAGFDIATTIQARGWYLLIPDVSAQVRASRGPQPITFWYTDGQSVQSIALGSLEIQ